MGAFDSIEMGHRCKGWLAQSHTPSYSRYRISTGSNRIAGQQWIVNASANGRIKEVMEASRVVLDGGPRWVLSTALGFTTGGLWWTAIYAAVFVGANYAMYANAKDASWTSGADLAGIVGYTILLAALSVASVPGAWSIVNWKVFASGLLVEVLLCVCVVGSVVITHSLFSPLVRDNPGWSMFAFGGRWFAPAVFWAAASKRREEAAQAIELKLSSLWCCHPTGPEHERLSQVVLDGLWNDWAHAVRECAWRVGGYSMLGFSAGDFKVLSTGWPTPNAFREIQHLRSYVRLTAR